MWINTDQIPGSVKMNRNRVLCRNVIQMGETTKIRELFSTLAATKVWRLLISVSQCWALLGRKPLLLWLCKDAEEPFFLIPLWLQTSHPWEVFALQPLLPCFCGSCTPTPGPSSLLHHLHPAERVVFPADRVIRRAISLKNCIFRRQACYCCKWRHRGPSSHSPIFYFFF